MTLEDCYRVAEQCLSTENTSLLQREAVWGQRWGHTPCEWVSEGQKKALEKSSPLVTLDYRILLFSFSASELQLLSDSKEAQSSLLPKKFSLKALILNMSKDPWSLEGSYVHHYTTKANNSSCSSFGCRPWFLLCSSISSLHNHQEGCNTRF